MDNQESLNEIIESFIESRVDSLVSLLIKLGQLREEEILFIRPSEISSVFFTAAMNQLKELFILKGGEVKILIDREEFNVILKSRLDSNWALEGLSLEYSRV
jgi:hypothetical protein